MQISRSQATVIALLAIAWSFIPKGTIDVDLFWHLRVGEAVLDAGQIPSVERWSWIAEGRVFYPHSWLFDVLLTLLYRAGGVVAIGTFGALLGLPIVYLLYQLARRWRPDLPAAAAATGVLVATLLGAPVWSARAQVLDLLFVLLVLLLIDRSAERRSSRPLLWLPLIALLWANLHGAGILAGAVAGGAVLIERFLRGERQELFPLVVAAAASALAALASPLGVGIFTYPLETLVSPVQQALINEWQAISIDRLGGALIVVLLMSPWLGLFARPVRLSALLLALFWGWQSLGSVRYLVFGGPFLALLLIPGAAAAAGSYLGALLRRWRPEGAAMRARVPLFSGLLMAAVLATPRLLPAAYEARAATLFPIAAVDYLVERECRGRIVNNYGWGGYLGYRWGEQVGHYGAADAFGDELLRPYFERLHALQRDPGVWLGENGVTLALFRPAEPISQWLAAAGWEPLFADARAALYAAPGSQPCR